MFLYNSQMSLDVEKLIPVDFDEQQKWISKNWSDRDDFTDAKSVRVAFRTISSARHDHWLNRLAASVTSKQGERSPAGKMCHAELLIPVSNGRYVKASVIKKSYAGTDAKGNVLFKKGCVHLKMSDPREWQKKYVFLQLSSPRAHIKKMMQFFLLNNGQPFNHRGYLANLVVPGGIGVKQWDHKLMRVPRSYFCTELLVTGLQCLSDADKGRSCKQDHWKNQVFTINPATSNPNLLYRILKSSGGVFDDLPIGKGLELL